MSHRSIRNRLPRSALQTVLLLLPSALLELPSSSQRDEIWASFVLGQEIWGHGVRWCCPRWLTTDCPPPILKSTWPRRNLILTPPSSRPGSLGNLPALSPSSSVFFCRFLPHPAGRAAGWANRQVATASQAVRMHRAVVEGLRAI